MAGALLRFQGLPMLIRHEHRLHPLTADSLDDLTGAVLDLVRAILQSSTESTMTYQEVCDKLVKLETDLAAAHAVSAAKDTTIADLTAKLAAIPAPAATADQLDAIGAKIDQIDAGVAA